MNNKKWEFEREKCVLMVIDMQNDFVLDGAVMQVKEAKRQLHKIKELLKKCRELNVPVIYTVHETDTVLCPLEVAAFPHLKNSGMRRGSKGTQIVDELAPAPGDIVIHKRRFSAFYQTDLDIVLRNIKGADTVDTIIICGTVTNICCESTARDAFFRDYKVIFGTDICSATSQKAHEATLENMEIFGRTMDCQTIIKSLENGCG